MCAQSDTKQMPSRSRSAVSLGIQLLVTEVLSVLVLGFGSGHWLAGLIAPLWGIAILPSVLLSMNRPLHYQIFPFAMVIVVCFVVVILTVIRRCHKAIGHICLFVYNLLSFLLLLGLK